MITKYFCEECGREFQSDIECQRHEAICHFNITEEKADAIVKYGLDKMCDHCENVYYVYGCEQDCKYSRVCLRRDRFPFWRPQKDEE